MKCLILGGGGFIGSHLGEALLEKGFSVRLFDRPGLLRLNEFPDSTVEWVEGDFINHEDLSKALDGCDVVFHLISTTLPKSSNDNPIYDVETNLVGTLQLLELSRLKNIKKVIFVSSGGTVYGVPQKIPIREDHSTEPICSYGICKLAIEKYLHLYRNLYDLDYCVLRLANPYGERQRINATQGAVAIFLSKAIHDEVIEIWGDGTVVRDYIYIKDAVNAMVESISYLGEERVFNIGSGEGHSLNHLIRELEDLVGREVKVNYKRGRELDVPVNVLDINLAIKNLNWQPRLTLRQGLQKTVKWMIRQDEGTS